MNKLLLYLVLIFLGTNTISIGQTDANLDITPSTEKIKRHSLGIGVPFPIIIPVYISSILNLTENKYSPKIMTGYPAFLNLNLTYGYYINKKFFISNYLRFDIAGPSKKSSFRGINLYSAINYNILYKKKKALFLGIGVSAISGQYFVWYHGEAISTNALVILPIFHTKYEVFKKNKSTFSIFNYTGLAWPEFYLDKRDDNIKNYRLYSNLQGLSYGNNWKFEKIFTNIIGINYEVNF